MSQVIGLCRDSGGDDGEWPNIASASAPPLPNSRKRTRDEVESSNDAHLCNMNGPEDKTTTGSAEFGVDLELADEVNVVSPHKKRHGIAKTGECLQILKGVNATERDVDREDSEQTSRDDGSATKHFQKLSISKPPSNAAGRQCRFSAWEDRLSELAAYRKISGHCNVPKNYSKNTKLAKWVGHQRNNYRLHQEGKTSHMTLPRARALEKIGFEWRLVCVTAWEDHLSELADYRKINGHCNVPQHYSENTKLAKWVSTQRTQYRLHLKGKPSRMTLSRIRELESIGFGWGVSSTPWGDRLSELADFRKIHGHCNVPTNYSRNTKLANWVKKQRSHYKYHRQGKRSQLTLPRIQALESLSFEWTPSIGWGKGTSKTESLDDDATRVRKRAVEPPRLPRRAHQQKEINPLSHTEVVSPPRNRWGIAKCEQSGEYSAAGQGLQIPKGVHATEIVVDSKCAQAADDCESHEDNPAAITPARAKSAAIAAAPSTSNSIAETDETMMVCKVIKRGQDGEEDKSIGFFILKSQPKSFVDARQAMLDQGVPINMNHYRFLVPNLGPISVTQESILGPMLAFLEMCTPRAEIGDGSFANPVKVFLAEAPVL